MDDVLLVTYKDLSYTQNSDGESPGFDVSLFAHLIDADVGHAVAVDGSALEEYRGERMHKEILEANHRSVIGSFHEDYYPTSDTELTEFVTLRDGTTVPVSDYDIVLVSLVSFHVAYLSYLRERFPELPLVAVQDESYRDILYYSPAMQYHHMESLDVVDGVIVEDPVYEQWVAGVHDSVLRLPLLIPENQFADVSPLCGSSERSGVICLGSVPFNVELANLYSGFAVYQQLREQHEVEGEFIGVKDWQTEHVKGFAECADGITVREFVDDGFYDLLSRYDIAITMTARISAGRLAAEFAGVGVPCIGTNQNDLQRRCFPELGVSPHDLETAIRLADRLLTDDEFYQETVEHAREAVAELQNHRKQREQLEEFITGIARERS